MKKRLNRFFLFTDEELAALEYVLRERQIFLEMPALLAEVRSEIETRIQQEDQLRH